MPPTKIKGSQVETVTSATSGVAPASGGGTANYLRADGNWANPISTLKTGAFVNISVGTTAPGSPAVGDLWVDTN